MAVFRIFNDTYVHNKFQKVIAYLSFSLIYKCINFNVISLYFCFLSINTSYKCNKNLAINIGVDLLNEFFGGKENFFVMIKRF